MTVGSGTGSKTTIVAVAVLEIPVAVSVTTTVTVTLPPEVKPANTVPLPAEDPRVPWEVVHANVKFWLGIVVPAAVKPNAVNGNAIPLLIVTAFGSIETLDSGADVGVKALEVAAVPVPTLFLAATATVYSVPFVMEEIVRLVADDPRVKGLPDTVGDIVTI